MSKAVFNLIALCVICSALSWPRLGASESLTWQQCVQETLQSNSSLTSASETVAASRFKTKVARAGYLPQLKATSGYQHVDSFNSSQSFSDSSNSSGSETDGVSFGTGSGATQFSSSLTLTQNVFSGFSDEAKIAQGMANEAASLAALQLERAKVSFDLRSAYSSMNYAQEYIKLAKIITKRRQDNLSIVKLRFEGGNENKGSYLFSEASYSQAILDAFEAHNALSTARVELARILGRSVLGELQVSGPQPTSPPPQNLAIDQLALLTPQYAKALAIRNAAEQDLNIAEAKFYPSLDINSQLSNRDNNSLDGDGRFLLGINLSFPLFTGHADYYSVKAAKATLASTASSAQSEALLARATIERAWSAFKEAAQRVEVNEKFVSAASVRAEISRSRYNNGLLSFEDWDQIENDLITRQKNLLQSRHQRVVAEATWEQSLGKDILQ